MAKEEYLHFFAQLDVLSRQESFDDLKVLFQSFITENGNCKESERIRKNISRLRLEIDEREARRLEGLRQLDRNADDSTVETILRKIRLEKHALAEAIDSLLVSGELSPLEEATFAAAKAMKLSSRGHTVINRGVSLLIALCVTVGIYAFIGWFFWSFLYKTMQVQWGICLAGSLIAWLCPVFLWEFLTGQRDL